MALLIRIEGCNFSSTLFDTDDLLTIRGASLANLRLPEHWPSALDATGLGRTETIVVGASDGVYRFYPHEGVNREDVEKKVPQVFVASSLAGTAYAEIVSHLSFTWAVIEENGDYKVDLRCLLAACGARQLQCLSVDVPAKPEARSETTRPCPVDRRRPVGPQPYEMPDGRQHVSESVSARREYGRKMRRDFYKSEGAPLGEGLDAAGSFADLVDGAPAGVPPAFQSKMAVIYLDGNKFTAIREAIVFPGDAGPTDNAAAQRQRHHAFAEFVRTARRALLQAVVGHLRAQRTAIYKDKKAKRRLRFETLLWGGDEAMFVLPAWEVMSLLPILASALEEDCWSHPQGYTLSHAVGIAICNYKTLIVVAKDLAEDIVKVCKPLAAQCNDIRGLSNVFSWQIHESVEPPQGNLKRFRESLYGTPNPEAFTLRGQAEVEEMLTLVRRFQSEGGPGTDNGLPLSQLYGLIRRARQRGPLRPGEADAKSYQRDVAATFRRCGCALLDEISSPRLGYTPGQPLMPLLRLAEIWDYVDPFRKASSA